MLRWLTKHRFSEFDAANYCVSGYIVGSGHMWFGLLFLFCGAFVSALLEILEGR